MHSLGIVEVDKFSLRHHESVFYFTFNSFIVFRQRKYFLYKEYVANKILRILFTKWFMFYIILYLAIREYQVMERYLTNAANYFIK